MPEQLQNKLPTKVFSGVETKRWGGNKSSSKLEISVKHRCTDVERTQQKNKTNKILTSQVSWEYAQGTWMVERQWKRGRRKFRKLTELSRKLKRHRPCELRTSKIKQWIYTVHPAILPLWQSIRTVCSFPRQPYDKHKPCCFIIRFFCGCFT